MLVLSRHADESILIGSDIVVTVVAIRGDKVRLGITAPAEVEVDRREIRDAKLRDQGEGEGDGSDPDSWPAWTDAERWCPVA